jgi:NAD dependent epimerase/dehydratase family enzyme
MNVVITGASGFVGSYMVEHFLDRGDSVTGLGRSTAHPTIDDERLVWISADTTKPGDWQKSIAEADLVVNLAGVNIFNRWSEAYKRSILESRVLTTQNVVAAISPGRETTLFSTSAIG